MTQATRHRRWQPTTRQRPGSRASLSAKLVRVRRNPKRERPRPQLAQSPRRAVIPTLPRMAGRRRGRASTSPDCRRIIAADGRNRRKSQRLVAEFVERQARRGRDRHGEPVGNRYRLSRNDGAHDGRSFAARAGATVFVERLSDIVATHGAALFRRRRRAADRTGPPGIGASATRHGPTIHSSTLSSRVIC